jgi:hypothetical protein
MTPRNTLLTIVLISAVGLSGAAVADVRCARTIGAVDIDDTIIVTGACVLNGTRVDGNVLLNGRGSLTVRDAEINGSIQADSGEFVRVLRSDVVGNIQLEGLHGQESSVARTQIGGSLQLKANTVRLVNQYNTINADLQAFGNTGGVIIRYNTIDGNLQCKSNVPRPTGGFNTVAGTKEDQCARL